MPSKFRTRFKVEDEVPTSSMADIAFLLIIFFMVTTVFAARKGLNMQLPKPEPVNDPSTTEKAVYVKIYPDGKYLVDRTEMELFEIRAYVNDKISVNPEKFVIIHPSDDADFGSIIDALDEVRQSGATNISLPSREEIAAWPIIEGFNDF